MTQWLKVEIYIMVTATRTLRAVEYNTVCADIELTWRESPQGKKKFPGTYTRIVSDCLFIVCWKIHNKLF